MMSNKKRKERPLCPFTHEDCFALMQEHRCFCLDDTKFKEGRDCPFYKTESEVDHDIIVKKYMED